MSIAKESYEKPETSHDETARHGSRAKSKSVLSVPLQEAIEEAQPKLFTWRMVQLYYCMFIAMLKSVFHALSRS